MTLRIEGGRVLMPDMSVERADVLLDRDSGEILAVGEVPAGDRSLDASGGLVMPGLVNAHSHLAMTLLRGYADDKPLEEWLEEDIWPVEAALTPEDIRAGTELALVELIKSGTTTVTDMYFEMAEVASAVETAGIRAMLGRGCLSVGKEPAAANADFEEGLAFAEQYHGTAEGRIRTAFMPHSLTTVERQYYEEYVPEAHDQGMAIHYHANETDAEVTPIVEREGVRPLEYARELGLTTNMDFIAHGVHLSAEEIEVLAETGTGVVHCPASNMKLASGMAPVQQLRDAGVPVGLGTDGAASNNDLDMFDEMRDAAMIGKLAAGDPSAVKDRTVVEMATIDGANLLGFNSGQLVAGMNADIIVLDLDVPHLTPAHDLVSHLAYAARGSDVRHTVCDGEILMQDREVQSFDTARVQERAEERAADLVARAESS